MAGSPLKARAESDSLRQQLAEARAEMAAAAARGGEAEAAWERAEAAVAAKERAEAAVAAVEGDRTRLRRLLAAVEGDKVWPCSRDPVHVCAGFKVPPGALHLLLVPGSGP